MVHDTTKRATVVLTVLLVAVGTLAGTTAATSILEDGDDSALDLEIGVDGAPVGGEAAIDCTGTPPGEVDCDKAGLLDLGVAALHYDGYNGWSVDDAGFGLGDEFVLEVADEEYGVAFDCTSTEGCDGEYVAPDDGDDGDGDDDVGFW